jgi:hypothetical protein
MLEGHQIVSIVQSSESILPECKEQFGHFMGCSPKGTVDIVSVQEGHMTGPRFNETGVN